MAKLYKLAEDLETAYQLLAESVDEETGEINPDAINLLNECKESFDDKISGLVEFIKRLSADYEAYKKEETRLAAMKKSTDNKIDWLKGYIKSCLEKTGRDKVETTSCKVSLSSSHAVNITNLEALPAEYKSVEQTVKVDKKALADAFKQGQEIAGAEYVTNINLRIR